MNEGGIQELAEKLSLAVQAGTLLRIVLHKKRQKQQLLQKVVVRPVELKSGYRLSANFTFPTQDETKNFTLEEFTERMTNWLGTTFMRADLETTTQAAQLLISKKGKAKLIIKNKAQPKAAAVLDHDQARNRLVPEDRPYLEKLGISRQGKVKPSGQKKYKQIDKYIEIIASLLAEVQLDKPLRIADMGSGKGYLTFALFDYLRRQQFKPKMQGIELRPDLVEKTSVWAQELGWTDLSFLQQDIRDFVAQPLDVLIALHACDTATDEAIAKGIQNNAKIIVVAPCCHKQIRKQMTAQNSLAPLLDYGILLERQAELVTDGLRALLLQQHGYQTKVFEFISTEHTGKNVMITAVKKGKTHDVTAQIQALKTEFSITHHALETLLA